MKTKSLNIVRKFKMYLNKHFMIRFEYKISHIHIHLYKHMSLDIYSFSLNQFFKVIKRLKNGKGTENNEKKNK